MNFGGGGGLGGGSGATAGPDLQEIETEQLAFQTASGDDRLRLLPSPWPADNLPPNTASLLSVAQTKGLVAAASPDSLVIASTDIVRSTLTNAGDKQGNIKAFTPQATIPIPRISQVAFSSDESCLVITAEQGGGLAVYDTNTLTNGGKEPAFQLATEGQSVRQVLPNPNPSADLSRYFGVVTENGQLLLADLKEQKLVQTSNGSNIFHEKVSCACWSRLGKQIVAGLADGTAVQIDPQGVVKATIPEPPQLSEYKQNSSAIAWPITSILWLDTYDFLIIHTPINQSSDSDGMMPQDDSIYHLAHRDKQSGTVTFSKLQDPCPPFGMESRKPAHHFILRLREWLSLSDLLILSSTASSDIGIFTRSKQPLDSSNPVTEAFTHTRPPDSRRPAMPMGAEGDTSPIGMAVDLSVKEKISRPIPTDETIDESPVPLPAVLVLDNEGALSLWYVVYNESVKNGEPFADLIAAGGPRALGGEAKAAGGQSQQQSAGTGNAFGSSANASSPFGAPQQQPATSTAFGTPSQPTSVFGQSSTPAQTTSTFGQSSTPAQSTSAFGQPSGGGAIGSTSAIGMRQSPWGGTSNTGGTTSGAAFGKPAFGASTFGQPSTFGQVGGGMGMNKGSVWGTPHSGQPQQSNSQRPASAFGSSNNVFGGNTSSSSPFMNLGGNNQSQGPSASPFATAGNKTSLSSQSSSSGGSGFASLGQNQTSASPFASAASQKPALSTEPSGSTVSFGSGMSFGSGSTNFGVQSLGSPTPTPQAQTVAQSREETMGGDDENDTTSDTSTAKPASQQGGGLFGLGGGGFKLGSTFKSDGTAKDDGPKPKDPGAGLFGEGFGKALGDTTADATKKAQSPGSEAAWMSGRSSGRSTPVVKKEPGTEEEVRLNDIPAAATPQSEPEKRLPKVTPVDDAPLPPDPATFKPKAGALAAPVPPGFESVFGSKPIGKAAESAPFPPDSGAKKSEDAKPLAGSPPVDLGSEKFSEGVVSPLGYEEAAGPPESEGDEGEWSDEDEVEDEEGSAVAEEDQDHTPQVIEDPKGLSAFEARLTPADSKKTQIQQPTSSPSPARQTKSTTPATQPKKDSYTPAGMPKAPVIFQPPQPRGQESPRSPSPQRSATSPARAMPPSFGSSAVASGKGMTFGKPSATPQQSSLSQPSQLPPPSQPRASTLMSGSNDTARSPSQSRASSSSQQSQQPQRIAVPPAQLQQKPQRSPTPAKSSEPTEGSLEDEEDARIQTILAAPIEPVTEVPAFLAHQDYVATGTEKEGLGGQIERVFRDINSMIDTLALNARSLRGFVEGNSEGSDDAEGRGRVDLEEEDGWVLGEAGQLKGIIEGVELELEDGKLEDVRGAVEGLVEEEKEVARMRGKCAEMRRVISAKSDPEQRSKRDAEALDMEGQSLQSELRQGVLRLQELLGKAEDSLSLLRAELASSPAKSSGGDGKRQQPTVEAVTNTILKMTAMVEQRSGDIDVLESKIRRLGGPTALGLKANYEDDLAATLKASRLSQSSPSAFRSSKVGMLGSPAALRLRASMRASPSPGSPFPKKSLFDVDEGEVEAYRAKREGRQRAMERLREQIEVRGPRVVKVGS